jgi:hypothetical protein
MAEVGLLQPTALAIGMGTIEEESSRLEYAASWCRVGETRRQGFSDGIPCDTSDDSDRGSTVPKSIYNTEIHTALR